MRRIYREKLGGDLTALPTRDQIETQAAKEADAEVFFQMRREFLEDLIDFPEPVFRAIHDFGGAKPAEVYVPELTQEAVGLERKTHLEARKTLGESVQKLANEIAKENIDKLRKGLGPKLHEMARSGESRFGGTSVYIKPLPKKLLSLRNFDKTLSKQIFQPSMVSALEKHWTDFHFTVFLHSDEIAVSISGRRRKAAKPKPLAHSTFQSNSLFGHTFQPKPANFILQATAKPTAQADSEDFVPCGFCCSCRKDKHNLKRRASEYNDAPTKKQRID